MLKIKIKRKRLLKENMDAAVSELRQLMSGRIGKDEADRMEELVGDNEALISYVNSHADSLDLDDLSIKRTSIPRLNLYQWLRFEYIYGDKIKEIEGIQVLTKLEVLSLTDNEIFDISPLAGLINLKGLYLSANNISDVSPLSSLNNLEYLSIYRNNISSLSALSNLKGLKFLNISGNPVSRNEIANLQKALPNCEIDF